MIKNHIHTYIIEVALNTKLKRFSIPENFIVEEKFNNIS